MLVDCERDSTEAAAGRFFLTVLARDAELPQFSFLLLCALQEVFTPQADPAAQQFTIRAMFGIFFAAGGAALAAGYQSMSPTGQWYGRAFCGTRKGKQIALTFDDGPNDPHTLNLLDVLARHNVRATFFLIGQYVRKRPDIVRAIAQSGHVIGNHTYTHPQLIWEPAARVRDELTQCRSAIQDAIGEHSNLFRPPFGGRRPGTFGVVRELELEPIMWNITGYDWNAPSADYIEQKVTRRIRGGDVVLLHDGGHRAFGSDRSATVQAVDRLVARYKSEGFAFITIPEMMAD